MLQKKSFKLEIKFTGSYIKKISQRDNISFGWGSSVNADHKGEYVSRFVFSYLVDNNKKKYGI